MVTTPRTCRWGNYDDPYGSDVTVRWGLMYNLYADRLLGFNMFPQSVYEARKSSSCFVQCDPVSTRLEPFDDRDRVVFEKPR